jgi:hypothetical protein
MAEDYRTYELVRNGKVEHRGITKHPDQREAQHQTQFPGSRLKRVGPRKTKSQALGWERKQSKTVTPPRKRRDYKRS